MRTRITFSRNLNCQSYGSVGGNEKKMRSTFNDGVRMHCGVRYLLSSDGWVTTPQGAYHVGYVVNSVGVYADRIAFDYGFANRYWILPFKKLYFYSSELPESIQTSIDPVPDLKSPFSGAHLTMAET